MESKLHTALKRVDDLLNEHPINGKDLAFNEIKLILTNAHRFKQSWSEELESLMKKLLLLAVELRRSKDAKNALQTYQHFCVGTNVNSLDNVLGLYMDLAENRLKKATKETNKMQDEHTSESIEAKMMKHVAGEDFDDRTDREYLSPWIKFAYEACRNVMDILKNNAALEKRYHNAALRTFTLCKDYHKVHEFKKISDMLRKHYATIQENTRNPKENSKRTFITLTYNTLQNQLRTRFKQLSTATALLLWQDAFKCVQDIFDIMEDMEEPPNRSTMKKYYEELAKIFWVSNDFALYAYSLLQLFSMTEKEESRAQRATVFLLAVLSIPANHDKGTQDKDVYEKQANLSRLLGLSHMLTREELIKDMLDQNLLAYIDTSISEAYNILEIDFAPVDMCEQMSHIFETLRSNDDFVKFIEPLRKSTATKYILQLSNVYDNIEMEDALAYCSGLFSRAELEHTLISLAAADQIHVSLDHKSDIILFGQGLNAFESDAFRRQLQSFNSRVKNICKVIRADAAKKYRERHLEFIKATRTELDNIRAENQADFEYNSKVAKFKSEHAKVQDVIVEEQFEEAKNREAEEERRIQEEDSKRAAREREREQIEAKKQEQMKLLYSQLASSTEVVGKVTTKKVDDLIQKKQEEIEKKKLEKEKRMTKTVRNMNYLERALRETEAPLLDSRHVSDEAAAKEAYESRIKKIETRQKQQLDLVKREHELLKDIFPEENKFRSRVLERRRQAYEEKLKEYNEGLAEAKLLWEQRREKVKAKVDELQRKREEEHRRKDEEAAEIAERERIERDARGAAEAQALRKQQEEEDAERQKELDSKKRAAEAKGVYQPPYSRGEQPAYKPPSFRGEPRENAYRPPYEREDSADRTDVYRPSFRDRDNAPPSRFGRAPSSESGEPSRPAWRRSEPREDTYKPPSRAGGSGYVPPHLRGGGEPSRPKVFSRGPTPKPTSNPWNKDISAADDISGRSPRNNTEDEVSAPKWVPPSRRQAEEDNNEEEQQQEEADDGDWNVVGKKSSSGGGGR
uniref:PCI domain-containing protein n=1 Tax=Percolomonas cosmopolitus TaxID=63605 RepID=A0A7S1KQL8_9EUKA